MGLFPRPTDAYELGLPVGPKSNVYYVDPANGNDSLSGTSPKKPLRTITAAYAKCTANQHDVVAYIAGSSSISLTDTLTWAKNYTHLVGLAAPTFAENRARIFAHEDNEDKSPLVEFSGTGCIVKDLMIFNGPDDADCLVNVLVSGGRNYFENVHFAGGGHATNAIAGASSLAIEDCGGNTFRHCTIGLDTIAATSTQTALHLDDNVRRTVFEDCRFTLRASADTVKFVDVEDATAIASYVDFVNCLFYNTSTTTTMTEAFTVPASMQADARITLRGCGFVGATDIEGENRGEVLADMSAITAGGTAGLLQATNTT